MKKLIIALSLTIACSSAQAQSPYTAIKDDRQVLILNGIISKYILQNNPAFNWYSGSHHGYKPDSIIVSAMEKARGKFTFLLFGGSWCDDTQFILPKFFKLQEQAGFPDSCISFMGVDRQKKSIGNLADVFAITNVPTIIVLKAGKEVGRVVEYGKTGKWDVELMELLK